MKVKTQLTRMKDGRATFISVVDRAASRIPFRVLKADKNPNTKEDEMLNLSTLKTPKPSDAKKSDAPAKEAAAPDGRDVLAIVVHKDANLDEVKKALKDEGFDTERHVLSEDGQHIFKQVDFDEKAENKEHTIIKQDDNLVLIVKGFESWRASATSFSERIGVSGYYYGINVATNALAEVLQGSIREADSPTEAMDAVGDAISEFSDYMSALIQGLPAACFTASLDKVSKAAAPVPDADPTPPVPKPEDPAPAPTPTNEDDVKKTDTKTPEAKPEETKKTDAPAPVETTPAPVATETKPADPAPAPVADEKEKKPEESEIAKSMKSLAESMALIAKSQKDQADATAKLSEEVKTIKATAEAAVKKSDETEAKLKGTVAAPAPGDAPPPAPVKKNEAAVDPYGSSGSFDSAFMKRNRKS